MDYSTSTQSHVSDLNSFLNSFYIYKNELKYVKSVPSQEVIKKYLAGEDYFSILSDKELVLLKHYDDSLDNAKLYSILSKLRTLRDTCQMEYEKKQLMDEFNPFRVYLNGYLVGKESNPRSSFTFRYELYHTYSYDEKMIWDEKTIFFKN